MIGIGLIAKQTLGVFPKALYYSKVPKKLSHYQKEK